MATRIFSVTGHKNSGKTTLAVALAAEYARRGERVMTIKHGHHPAMIDREGTDTFRHFHEGKAQRVLLASPGMHVLFDRARDDYNPIELARRHMSDADVVLVEGYKRAPLPKVEVYRRAVSSAPIYRRDAANASEWVAIVTDDDTLEADCKVLRFRDTMWLQLLAGLLWEHALVLDP